MPKNVAAKTKKDLTLQAMLIVPRFGWFWGELLWRVGYIWGICFDGRGIGKLRSTLAAWFLLSDGFTMITSTAILFGETSLSMSPSALVLIGVLTTTSGIVMASAIPVYGCLGFAFQGRARFRGLTTQGEMFGLAVFFGSVYGAFQGYARAFFAELLPPGEEARWYGLFSITEKSSLFLGPLFVGIIADMMGNIRYTFFFPVVMI